MGETGTGGRVPTIVWDVDDVLNDLARGWLEWWRASGRSDAPAYEDLTENPPHRLLGIPVEEYLSSLDAYRLSDAARAQQPVPEVIAWFRQQGARYHHIAMTATPVATAPASAEWVVRHYGTWIRTFHFTPSPREGDGVTQRETKAAAVLRLGGADAVVDDMPRNLEGLEGTGTKAVLFPRPWNAAGGTVDDALRALTAPTGAGGRP